MEINPIDSPAAEINPDAISVAEAKVLFSQNPGIASVLTTEGILRRDGTFDDPHHRPLFLHMIETDDKTPAAPSVSTVHDEQAKRDKAAEASYKKAGKPVMAGGRI